MDEDNSGDIEVSELREAYEELNKDILELQAVPDDQLTEHHKKHAHQHFPNLSSEEAVAEFRQLQVLTAE